MAAQVAADADADGRAMLGADSAFWHLAKVREDARLGRNCVVGRGVQMGDNCKVQNHALVYEPARLGDGVFIEPAVVLTNDTHPRAVTPGGDIKSADDWEAVGVIIEDGAAIGARSVCVAPVTIGAWALVAAGSVVTKDVPPHALVVGVPARQIGWVDRSGRRLVDAGDGRWVSADGAEEYADDDGRLRPLRTSPDA